MKFRQETVRWLIRFITGTGRRASSNIKAQEGEIVQRMTLAFLAGIAVLLISSDTRVELKMPLGKWDAAVKVNYLQFSDEFFEEKTGSFESNFSTDVFEKDGVYVCLESYANVWEKPYVGAEVGSVKKDGTR